ncbi:hypothetical protein DFH08DRAFT_705802 [Mycena albidolilacea]|uniref:Integrase core domain-containing protein n=1 Tax=Mycena albidolilacea TaxID=1033008 RepID=A0AAD7ELX1_9AGAR|nr:hypothetical protein DFH08DRAFT_705802 [Mycena albidolilacea]
MILHQGPGRASFMWGSSTRNTRIERLWVEVGTQFARRWRAFFTRLGRMHSLDRKNPMHLWHLHRLFLDKLNNDCHEFQEEWNHHPMSGNMTGGQSPEVSLCLFVLIQFQLIGDIAGYAPSGTDHTGGKSRGTWIPGASEACGPKAAMSNTKGLQRSLGQQRTDKGGTKDRQDLLSSENPACPLSRLC